MPGLIPNIQQPGGPAQVAIVWSAAARWRISPQTLWGVYGVETGWGRNVKTSSAGANGPFQFMPGTARQYKVNVANFTSSAYGAAHYLHDLGANTDPDSPETAAALDKYSGGGGDTYVHDVRTKGEGVPKVKGANDPIVNAVFGAPKAAFDAATALPKFLGKLDIVFDGTFWLRVGMVLGGIAALLLGITLVGREFATSAISKAATGK